MARLNRESVASRRRQTQAQTLSWRRTCLVLLATASSVNSLTLNPDDPNSVKDVAKQVASDLMSYYQPENPASGSKVGELPNPPYYWWETGAMFGSMVDYWYYTGDTQYNDKVIAGLLAQVGENKDYAPKDKYTQLGNDDQGFWAQTVMTAAEKKFPDPPADKPQWLALAQGVFNNQAENWDTTFCGGGLFWQKFQLNPTYFYKNTISTGLLFNLAARLGRYTQNSTYIDWAVKTWDWMEQKGYIDEQAWAVYDGAQSKVAKDDPGNCTKVNRVQFSYNHGTILMGAATMYNISTGADQGRWQARVNGLVGGLQYFMVNKGDVMWEIACETNDQCNADQLTFKAYVARWMAQAMQLAPFTHDVLKQKLKGSAMAAVAQCTGTVAGLSGPGRVCGHKWQNNGVWDGTNGVGQQMSVLEVVQNLLIDQVAAVVTNTTGGTSQGDAKAGTGSVMGLKPVTTMDRVGAGILTAISPILLSGMIWFLVSPD